MSALIYRPNHKWRFTGAFVAAVIIHLVAVGFATTNRADPKIAAGIPGDPPEVFVEPIDPTPDPPPEFSDPLPTPPRADELFIENTATPPPIRKQASKSIPLVRPRTNAPPGSLNLSATKVLALNAPRPEYPYEARRQKITGDGIAVLTVDPNTGAVIHVTMAKSTGNQFLDNAALTGFSRWRFKPGTVSSVTCPITFTLTGASY
jgi:TonB family protein